MPDLFADTGPRANSGEQWPSQLLFRKKLWGERKVGHVLQNMGKELVWNGHRTVVGITVHDANLPPPPISLRVLDSVSSPLEMKNWSPVTYRSVYIKPHNSRKCWPGTTLKKYHSLNLENNQKSETRTSASTHTHTHTHPHPPTNTHTHTHRVCIEPLSNNCLRVVVLLGMNDSNIPWRNSRLGQYRGIPCVNTALPQNSNACNRGLVVLGQGLFAW